MSKKLRVLVCIFLLFPFFAWPQEPSGQWVSLPADGLLTIIGISNRRLRRDEEIESAKDDAARKALLYQGLKGKMRIVDISKPGPNGAYFNTETSLEPLSAGDLPAIREALRFDPDQDVFRTGSAVFVRFTCPAPGAERPDYRPAVVVSGQPEWTRRSPRIAGYNTAVGFAGKRRYIRETVSKSYENAAAELIAARSIHMETIDLDDTRRGAASYITGTAEGELQGFVVLEMWIDPKTGAVWTLAAARKTP